MPSRFYERPGQLFGVVGAAFLALSYGIAIAPAVTAQAVSVAAQVPEPSAQATRGLSVYVSEGCPYCHTQQVRPLAIDAVWGRPTQPADYASLKPLAWYAGTPGVLGSQRTGPDLSDVGRRQASPDWQLMHLFNPRLVSPSSVMPALPWLFRFEAHPAPGARIVAVPQGAAPAGVSVVATDAALDLVAYLLSLKLEPGAGAGGRPEPAAAVSGGASQGAQVFEGSCAACHQSSGKGVPSAFPALVGNPTVTAADPALHVATILHGLQGKTIDGLAYSAAMPAFDSLLNDAQIAAVVNHERTSWGNGAPLVTPEQVKTIRASGRKP
jgi:cytochrome c oxidase cbb3-type subunit 2